MAQKDENDKLIDEFSRMSDEGILRAYEKKNRGRINDASLTVRDAFDQVWKKVTGNSYYQPVTTVAPAIAFGKNNVERSDPRSRRYMAMVTLESVDWSRVVPRRKIGGKITDMWNLTGMEKGLIRPLFQNLTADRLFEVLKEKAKEVRDAKANSGNLKGPIEMQVEGYWEVMFSPAKSENDPVDVRLMWEGQCLVIKRMLPVVLPGFYLEVADNATRDHYTQTPKDGRKKIGVIQEYPYTVLREAQRIEYLKQKEAGDEAMRNRITREDG